MKGFKKLAIAAAIAAVPAAGLAMEPLQEEELSNVTGQDGISIELDVNMSMDLGFEDTDGVPGFLDLAGTITAENAGMIYLPGLSVNATGVTIDIDAGARNTGVGGDGVLMVDIAVPALSIGTAGDPLDNFELYVEGSGLDNAVANLNYATEQRDAATALTRLDNVGTLAGTEDPVLSLDSVTLTNMDVQLQLGDGAENLIQVTNAAAFSIQSTDLVLRDLSSTGALTADEVLIQNIELQGMTVSVVDDAAGAGLQIVAPASPNMAIAVTGVGFDDHALSGTNATTMGNVLLGNVNMAGTTMTIRGK